MRTRHAADYAPRLDHVYTVARDEPGEHVRALAGPMPDLWADWSLHHLYELDTPDIEVRTAVHNDSSQVAWLLSEDGSWARAEQASGTVHQSGSRRLWDDLERVRVRWEEAGRFKLHETGLRLTAEGGSLTSPDGLWTVSV